MKTNKKRFLGYLTFSVFIFSIAAFAKGWIQNEDVKSLSEIESAVLSTTGNLTSGSACIASPGSTTGLSTGLYVYDQTTSANIPSGTTIAGLPGTCPAGQIQLSANAAASATGDTISFGGQASQLVNDSKIYVSANSINDTLHNAVANGLIGGSGGGGVNLLGGSDNPGFEQGTGSWTDSGGTFTSISTGYLYGSKSGQWTASASGQTLNSALKSVVTGLYGANCMAAISYKYASGASGDYSLRVSDGTNIFATQSLALTSGSGAQDAYVTFTCPSSGSLELQLVSNVATPSAITVDGPSFNAGQALLGSNVLVSNVAQAQLYGSIKWSNATSCVWSLGATSGVFNNFPSNASCAAPVVTGAVTAPGTSTPSFNLNNAPPGTYVFHAKAPFYSATTGLGCGFQLSDGTNGFGYAFTQSSGGVTGAGPVIGQVTYTTAGNHTINLQAAGVNAAPTCDIDDQYPSFSLDVDVYYYPSASQLAVTSNTQPQSWSGYVSGCSSAPTANIGTGGTFYDFNLPSGCVVNTISNVNFPSVSIGSTATSITFTPNKTGKYLIIYSLPVFNSSATISISGELLDTNSNIISTGATVNSTASGPGAIVMTGILDVSSLTTQTIKSKVTGTTGNTITDSSSSSRFGEWSIIDISQNLPMPLLVGSVTSNTSGQERIERARVSCAASSSIISQSGSWISAIGNIVSSGCTLTTSAWSAVPSCIATVEGASAQTTVLTVNPTSSTSLTIFGSGTPASFSADVMCMGAK